MGRLIYRDRASFAIDDRILAHLRIVVMNKLRRNEGFMLQLPVNEGVRQASLWIHASNALVMQFYGGREPAIDRHLVDQMMHDASGADGLTLTLQAAGVAARRRGRDPQRAVLPLPVRVPLAASCACRALDHRPPRPVRPGGLPSRQERPQAPMRCHCAPPTATVVA